MTPIDCGLLQGDNLSQTFFTIVINEIVDVIKSCLMHLYADDLMIYKECVLEELDDAINAVNDDINGINEWVLSHGMNLNPTKTQAILISTPGNNAKINENKPGNKIVVNSIEIPFAAGVKYLGFHFNNDFTSGDHTNNIIKKVNFSLSNSG